MKKAKLQFIALFLSALFTYCTGNSSTNSVQLVDQDKDGFTAEEGDCDDKNANVSPDAAEHCSNGIDDDCDASVDTNDTDCPANCVDSDDDGYPALSCGGTDCNDRNESINPGEDEKCVNGKDDDCDGDKDSVDSECESQETVCGNDILENGEDCEDNGDCDSGEECNSDCECENEQGEVCGNGVKEAGEECERDAHCEDDEECNDCECEPEESDPVCGDGEKEGNEECEYNGQCGDSEVCNNSCECESAGSNCTDDDNDNYYLEGGTCGDVDCDDTDASVNPGEDEICGNGKDDDCSSGDEVCCGNGVVNSESNEECDGFGQAQCSSNKACTNCQCIETTCDTDSDGDGYISLACDGNDCDDNDEDTYPGADEICDSKDNDCDGPTDEGNVCNLVLYNKFDNTNDDSSGNNHDLSCFGTNYSSDSHSNKSKSFSGASQYCSADNSSTISFSSDFTIDVWVKPDSLTRTNNTILAKDGVFNLFLDEGRVVFCKNGFVRNCASSKTNLTSNTWNHIVVTHDSTSATGTTNIYLGTGDSPDLDITVIDSNPINDPRNQDIWVGKGNNTDVVSVASAYVYYYKNRSETKISIAFFKDKTRYWGKNKSSYSFYEMVNHYTDNYELPAGKSIADIVDISIGYKVDSEIRGKYHVFVYYKDQDNDNDNKATMCRVSSTDSFGALYDYNCTTNKEYELNTSKGRIGDILGITTVYKTSESKWHANTYLNNGKVYQIRNTDVNKMNEELTRGDENSYTIANDFADVIGIAGLRDDNYSTFAFYNDFTYTRANSWYGTINLDNDDYSFPYGKVAYGLKYFDGKIDELKVYNMIKAP